MIAKLASGPRAYRLIGALLDVRRDRLGFVQNARADFGDWAEFRMGPRPLLLISDPDAFRHILRDYAERYEQGLGLRQARPFLGQGLLTGDGRTWKSQRETLEKAFQNVDSRRFGREVIRAGRAMASRIKVQSPRAVDVTVEFARATLEVLGGAFFEVNLAPFAEQASRDVSILSRWAMDRAVSLITVPMIVPTRSNRAARSAMKRMRACMGSLLAGNRRKIAQPSATLDDETALEQIMTLLLAGHETTATTLAWAFFLLARHPDTQSRVFSEVDSVVGSRPPVVEDLVQLSYLRAVLKEVVRLYPPVWLIPRRAVANDSIGEHSIAAGTDVLLNVYGLHRHPRYWQRPDEFDPNRFCGDRKIERAGYAYLPFGAGRRACPGNRFGIAEAMLFTALLIQRYRWRSASSHVPIAEAGLTLHPKNGLFLQFVERQTL